MFNARPFAIQFTHHELRIFAEMQLFSAVSLPSNHANSIIRRLRDRLTTGEPEVFHELALPFDATSYSGRLVWSCGIRSKRCFFVPIADEACPQENCAAMRKS